MDTTELVRTRLGLHTLAEHVVAADLWHNTAKIGLRRTPGGFGQPEHVVDGERRRLRIDGTSLVVLRGDTETWMSIDTIGHAARAVQLEPGAPTDVFVPTTELRPDEPLGLDDASAARIAAWFELVDTALEEVRRRHRDDEPSIPQLWPEHFDLAFSVTEVNVGGSPGDGAHPEPYLYVGPWQPVEGPDWNESWGLSLGSSAVSDVAHAVEFFEAGLAAARPAG